MIAPRPLPSPSRRPADACPEPAAAACDRVSLSYGPGSGARGWRHVLLSDVSLVLPARRCTALAGVGFAPVALLRCIAGLSSPDSGDVAWLDAAGRRVAAPNRAFVPAEWRSYACFTVRDVLEHAVPAGTWQADADTLVADAAARCGLAGVLRLRLSLLPPPAARLTAVAAALVAGYRWLLLDRRPVGDPCRCGRGGTAASAMPASRQALPREGTVLRRLVREGVTIVVAGPPAACAIAHPWHRHQLAPGRIEGPVESRAARRVAEERTVATAMEPL